MAIQRPEQVSSLLMKTVERIRGANIQPFDYCVNMIHQAAGIEGVESVFQRIIERDDQTILDHLMEIKFGVLFKGLGFRAQFEPTGAKGPDLMVERDGVSAFLEVKRYRPKEAEHIPEHWGAHGTLLPYGDPNAQAQIADDLRCKLRQIRPRDGVEHGILAIWSDREFFEDVDFECAVREISAEAEEKGLRFCIFGCNWESPGGGLYCEPASRLETFKSWLEDLERAPNQSLLPGSRKAIC